jgi:transcriptional regulator with XRE-family HTH domain
MCSHQSRRFCVEYPTETLGQFVRRQRLEKGLEQEELAKKLRVHRNTVYEWENDRRLPTRKNIRGLVKFFGARKKALEGLKVEGKKVLWVKLRLQSPTSRSANFCELYISQAFTL